MNAVEELFHNDLKRSTFSEAVSDENFDFIDGLIDNDSLDDHDTESEEI